MDKLKERLLAIDWWETTYLIIYAIIFSKEFLQTTMFPIPWPLGLGYVFALMSGGYVIAKFLFHNTYTKKEMIFAILVLIAFCVPALTTDYTYLFWTGCLIVGAKDVDFNKILKVYLFLSITYMVVAFSASQYGMIEDLEYLAMRENGQFIRHSFGSVYPTDYAAHWFYIVLAIVVLFNQNLNIIVKLWLSLLVAGSVFLTSNAQTTMLCLVGFAGLCVFEKYLYKMERILCWIPIMCASGFIGLAYLYNPEEEFISRLNQLFSNRLAISHDALNTYPIKLFGQNIVEAGGGLVLELNPEYFFLDDSYVRILLKYGLCACFISLAMMLMLLKKAREQKQYAIILTLVAISIHSIMEHHLIDIAYNPILLAVFALLSREKQKYRRKICIEETVEAG